MTDQMNNTKNLPKWVVESFAVGFFSTAGMMAALAVYRILSNARYRREVKEFIARALAKSAETIGDTKTA